MNFSCPVGSRVVNKSVRWKFKIRWKDKKNKELENVLSIVRPLLILQKRKEEMLWWVAEKRRVLMSRKKSTLV